MLDYVQIVLKQLCTFLHIVNHIGYNITWLNKVHINICIPPLLGILVINFEPYPSVNPDNFDFFYVIYLFE
jgi:hypothetical protein